MEQLAAGPMTVDACKGGCGGLWFDNFELRKFDEAHERADLLLEIPVDPAVAVDHERRRACPKCDGIVMQRRFFSPKRGVEVDHCPGCAGYFLDAGELAAIRAEYPSEVERRSAMEGELDDLFGAEMNAAAARGEAELAGVRRFASAVRLICPSYYIPGKQSWGAF